MNKILMFKKVKKYLFLAIVIVVMPCSWISCEDDKKENTEEIEEDNICIKCAEFIDMDMC